MRHRAAGRDAVVAVGQNAGSTLTAADEGCARTVDRAVIALCTAGAELEHGAALRGAGDAVRLGGDQRLVVDGQQNHGLNELRLNHRACNGDERLAREYRRALGDSPDIAFELEVAQIVEKRLGEAFAAAEVCDVLLGEAEIFEVGDQLLDTGHDGIAAAVRNAAEEHIKVCAAVAHTLFKIAICHRELVEVGQHGKISFGHCDKRPFA